jgi:hypothetical protein
MELRAGRVVGSDGWSRSVGVLDVIPVPESIPKTVTEPLQSLLMSEKRTVGPWEEARVQLTKWRLEAVAP